MMASPPEQYLQNSVMMARPKWNCIWGGKTTVQCEERVLSAS